MSITQILLDKGLLTMEQMGEAMALQKAEDLRLDRALVHCRAVSNRSHARRDALDTEASAVSVSVSSLPVRNLNARPSSLTEDGVCRQAAYRTAEAS